MNVSPIIGFAYGNYSQQNKKRTNNIQQSQNISFKSFESTVARVVKKDISRTSWAYEYKSYFSDLLNSALAESTASNRGLLSRLLDTGYPIGQKLQYIKDNYSDTSVSLLSSNGKDLVTVENGGVKFNGKYDPRLEVQEYVFYSLDNDSDYLMERPFDVVTSYRNGNLKMVKVYSSDYSSTKTTHYNKDGSENALKNFFSGLL